MRDKVYIIGVGEEGPKGLGDVAFEIVRKAEVLLGGERHLCFFQDFPGEKIIVKSNLKEIADFIKSQMGSKRMAVLASGDPNFYGIAKYLISKLGKEPFEIIPAVSSMQLAFARVKESWDEATLVSVHGRPIGAIIPQIRASSKIGIFTDDEHTPGEIARALMEHGFKEYQAFVCENLGGEEERITETVLEKLPDMTFSPLNVLILKKIGEKKTFPDQKPWTIGIPEEEFEYTKPKRGLITKTEVRVISLSKMTVREDSVVWDIGAGSGSVSIEAALIAKTGRVYSIEKDEEDVGIIHRNLAKFEIHNVKVIHGRAPEALEGLEEPDAIFIGGSGGGMSRILEVCLERLKPNGRLVVNLATIENLSEAYGFFKQREVRVDICQVQVSRGSPILNLTRFEAFNPVFVIAVRKEC